MAIADGSAIENKLSYLVSTLIQKTREGKVSWNPTINDDEFLAGFNRYVVSIKLGFADEFRQERPYRTLGLLNKDGKTIDAKIEYDTDSLDYQELGELFVVARRSAHDAEESLNSLLQELESR